MTFPCPKCTTIFIEIRTKEVSFHSYLVTPSPQIAIIWSPKWPPLVSNCMRVTTKWCPDNYIGHKLNNFMCALQFKTCQRILCKQKLGLLFFFFLDIGKYLVSQNVANAVRCGWPSMSLWEKPKTASTRAR